jgi:two-component system, NarL family, sensor kinase
MQKTPYNIVLVFLVVASLLMLMTVFVFLMIYLHRKKQIVFLERLKEAEINYDKSLLSAQLEIQEQTFQHISREIHDNINLSLTLAKLNLNTLDWNNNEKSIPKIDSSIELLTQSIAQLSDMSKSLDADIINRHGLLKAIEDELQRIRKTEYINISYTITGNPVYLNSKTELVIFRIIQEAFNNILKHADAKEVSLQLHYNEIKLGIRIMDDGVGFDPMLTLSKQQAGLKNMKARTELLGGEMEINSRFGEGSIINFIIPFEII